MKYEHKELIHDYLWIDKQNRRIEERMIRVKTEFHAQNFYRCMNYSDTLGVKSKNFNIESKVTHYVDILISCERNIAKNKRRQHYFKRFTDTLDTHTYSSLTRRYSNINHLDDMQELGHDEIVLEELLEIEEAISHEFDFEKLPEFDKKSILVEYNNLEPDTLEHSFEAMLEVLGV